ncbi:MAG: hypothetical protein ACI4V1_10790 [Eubacteriales bacterium]
MKFTGKWACTDYLDTQLNVMPDGTVYVTYSERGEYSVHAQAEITEDKLTWTACGVTGTVELAENGNQLTGTCSENGASEEVMFLKTPAEPEALPYHYAPSGTPAEIPAGFPLTLEQLVGQWKSESLFGWEMNLFSRERKAELQLCLDGCTVWHPVSFWLDPDAVVWQINDAYNRATCTLRPENGELVGTYRQIHHAEYPPVIFRKLSDTPVVHGEFVPNIELPYGSRLDLLRANAAYGADEEPVTTEYVLGGSLPSGLEDLGYAKYLDGKTGDNIAFACLDFICDHFHHKGDSGMPSWKTRSLADFLAWCGKHDNRTNCRGLSIMLGNLLRYNGIRAQHVTCQPYEDPFDDCHVVVDCILPSGKRVMLDPTYRLYFRDADGEYVSLPRLREILISGEKLIPNETASYTGGSGFDLKEYRNYMAKNTLRFSKDRVNADGRDEYEPMWLFPVDYPYEKICDPDRVIVRTDDKAFWGESRR